LLPLRIFEDRYMDMAKDCLKTGAPFGVCLIKEGKEVGAPARPHEVGCLARIVDWDMPQLGVLHVKAEGIERFRVMSAKANAKGLLLGEIAALDNDRSAPVTAEDNACISVLQAIIDSAGEENFLKPFRFDDATWLGNRLAEILPMDLSIKQQLLELSDGRMRLEALRDFLHAQGLLSPP
jgi:uncharacterized protein